MPRPWLALALLLHVVLATGYAWSTPDFEGPDENSHYEYAQHLANAGKLPLAPALAQARGLPQTDGAVLAHHPPLYYALLAAVLVATGTDDTVFGPLGNPSFGKPDEPGCHLHWLHAQGVTPVLFLLRLVSVLLGAVSLVLVHRLGLACCPDRPRVADLAALLAACLPMGSFLHGVLNNDVLAIPLCGACLLLLVRCVQAELPSWRQTLLLGVLLGLALLTKLTTLFLVPLALFALVPAARRAWLTGRLPALLARLGVAALLPAAIAGWVFVRNHSLYGDALATNVHDAAFAPIPPELRLGHFVARFLPDVFLSLLGRFGWFSLPPHPALPWLAAAVLALALLGLVRAHVRGAGLLAAALGLVFAGTAWFNWTAPQPQGRLLLPAVGPASVLLAAGLERLSAGLRWRRWLALLAPLLALLVWAAWFRPAFAIALAPAPASHRALVGGIVHPAGAPAIPWQTPAEQTFAAPPLLRWRDPGAPPDTRYTLYAYDTRGRVHLATHEWSKGGIVLQGGEATLPAAAWSFLPKHTGLFLVLRRVPTHASDEVASLPRSAPLPLRVD